MTAKMKSFVKGILAGLAGKPLEFAKGKEPVAYLYNGVRLPKLPEWDKSKYPYAVLFTEGNLWVMSEQPVGGDGLTRATDANYEVYAPIDGVYTFTSSGSNVNVNYAPHWSNCDIYYYNDATALYLAASDPVPVYE